MRPGEDPDMENPENKDGKDGAKGSKQKPTEEHKEMPTDPTELLQLQTFRSLRLMEVLVEQVAHLAARRPGPGEPGGSDPESSDSCDDTGIPKNRDGDPVYHARQKKKTKRAIKRIGPPTFKGEPGKRPEAHLLRTLDWFDAIGIMTDSGRLRSFKHTLDSNAREWFADLWKTKIDITWDLVTNEFSRYFSTQGRSNTHLHNAWKAFTFDPDTMDIEDFIRDVQECGTQLQYGEHSIMEMIKSCMPKDNFGTLYKMDDLAEVISYCKDRYAVTPAERAKKAAQANATGTNPFSSITSKRQLDIGQHLNKITETLNKLDFKQKPYKPQIYPNRGRGRGRGRGQPWGRDQGQGQGYQGGKGGFQSRGNYKGKPRGGRFDKSPTKRNPRINSKTKDVDKDRCRYCREIGHWERECPQKKKDQGKGEEPKPYGAFTGLSEALPEFYGQAALTTGNPAIGEMYHGITEVLETECKNEEPEYLN